MALNFQFTPELMLHTGLLQLRLEQNLDSDDCLMNTPLFSCQINAAEFSFAEWTSEIKVFG
jgi:hypothetical protein